MLKKLLFLFFSCLYFFAFSQSTVKLSAYSQISIITSGPGDSLYEKFGHTSIRIKDPILNLDLNYNYGIFDLDGPKFYVNFTKGYMKYKLASYPFHYTLKFAQEDKRWVKQQVLNLTIEERNTVFHFLNNNAKPENSSYLYDPFFNNCATKPRDILNEIIGNKIIWANDFTSNKSFRELMNKEIHQNTWGSVGINLALGSKLDRIATAEEYLYLPDYVFEALSKSKILKNGKEESLVKKTHILLDFEEKKSSANSINPFLVFSFLLIIGGFITTKDYRSKKRTKWFDFILFFITGLLGVLIIFLWFFTNHSTAPNNFNILWSFTPNLIVAFYLLKNSPPNWLKKYCLILLLLLIVIPIIWILKIQLFNWTFIPLLILLATRYLFLQKTLNS